MSSIEGFGGTVALSLWTGTYHLPKYLEIFLSEMMQIAQHECRINNT